jgi:hypothetical protein
LRIKLKKKSIIQKDLKQKITVKKMMIKVEIKNKLEKIINFFIEKKNSLNNRTKKQSKEPGSNWKKIIITN